MNAPRAVARFLAHYRGAPAPSAAASPEGLPLDAEVLLQALDRLQLAAVARAFTGGALRACPRSTCTRPLAISEANYFACSSCGVSGGTAAFVAAFFWDWDNDRVHRALCTDPGCCEAADG